MSKPKRAVSRTKLAVVLSDMHCGSSVGLAHPESEQASGNIVSFGSNVHHAWLWDCWREALLRTQEILGGDRAALIVNGDAMEGCHHRTTEIIASTIAEHTMIAAKCLEPWKAIASRIYLTKGTECHTHSMEDVLADLIDAEEGQARDKWLLEINGCLIDAAHHMGVTSRRYLEASGMGIAMGNARQNYLDAGQRAPRVFLRGHRHCGGWYNSGHSALGVTGGFQWLTRHGHKVVTDSIPHPSILVLDWRQKGEGELPHETLIKFDPPHHEITRL